MDGDRGSGDLWVDLARRSYTPAERPESGRAAAAAGRAIWLAVSVCVLAASMAVAQGGDGGGAPGARDAARGDPVQIQVRNRSSGETGLVTSSDDYSLRLSNTKENGGGGAVYGCRAPSSAPADDRACLYADNLRGGEAFLFRSREGTKVGHFDLGNPAGAPFSTNATGLVGNLNADRLDNLHAADIIGQARSKSGLAAETADTATNATNAGNADTVDGANASDLKIKSAFTSTIAVIGLTGTPAEVMSVPITTDTPSNIFAQAMIEIDSDGGADDRVFCRLSRGTYANAISNEPQADLPDGTFDRSWFGLTGAAALDSGTYDIKLFCGEASGNVSSVVGNLIVWAIPTNP